MKISIDPYMIRRLSVPEMVKPVADCRYQYIELLLRPDFTPFSKYPRADKARCPRTGMYSCRLCSPLPLVRPHRKRTGAAVKT